MELLDHYCERTDPSFWAEPVNALSNLAFFAAAWWLWREAHKLGRMDGGIMLLLAWAVATGIGSFLFHTFANTATFWLDVIPILLFLLTYLWLSVRRVLNWGTAAAAASAALLMLSTLAAGQFGDLLNGAPFYIPTLLMLMGLTFAHWSEERPRTSMLLATTAFAIALLFRTIDDSVCSNFPLGTHFLWHLLTSVAIFFGTRALIERPAIPGFSATEQAGNQ